MKLHQAIFPCLTAIGILNTSPTKMKLFIPRGAAKLLDFYESNEKNGVRKKVQPQLGNKFLVTQDLNNFKITL